MANEITVSMSLSVVKGSTSEKKKISAVTMDLAGTDYIHGTMQVPTTAGGTAIPLGAVTGPNWAMFTNNDATNFIELLDVASTGAKMVQLLAGESACFRLGTGAQVPAAFADTAICEMDYLIIEL